MSGRSSPAHSPTLHRGSSVTSGGAFPASRIPTPKSHNTRLQQPPTPGLGSVNRKRARTNGPDAAFETPYASGSARSSLGGTSGRSSYLQSPVPFVSTRYQMSGGLDTPTRAIDNQFDALQFSSEDNCRTRWSSSVPQDDAFAQVVTMEGLRRTRNGQRQTGATTPPDAPSWSGFMFGLVTGLAGKVYNVCKTTAFGGFTAGSGAGYAITPSGAQQIKEDSWRRARSIPRRQLSMDGSSTPVPGQYPMDEDEDSVSSSQMSSYGDARPAKRLQIRPGEPWVVVDRPQSRMAGSRNSSSTATAAHRPLASHMSPRVGAARRARISSPRISSASIAGPARAEGKAKQASHAPVRSPAASPQHTSPRSPASVEVEKYAAKRRKEERQSEASIRKLNQQLKAMIREGQEALGTRVEVHDEFMEDDLEDEGFAEGDLEGHLKA